MAQKSKAAAQQPRTSKGIAKAGKTSTVKKAAAAKPAKAASGKPVKISVKAAKPAPPVKAAKAKAAKPAVKAAPAAPKAEKQIEQAKAALKKQSAKAKAPANAAAPAAPAKAEGKPRTRKISIDINPNEAASALAQKWTTLYKKAEQIEAKPYNMKAVFEEKTAITHKILGWGYILANRNDRLEVLFKDGIKYLISNYKP